MAYTTIDNGEEHFQILHYTGNGSTSSGITRTFDGSVDLKPGLTYHHKYAGGGNYTNIMENEYTGAGTHWLASSGDSVANDGITASFDTDGFTHATQNLGGYYHNENGKSYGVWAWSETGVSNASNTDGDITSTVRVHPTAGWSIVNWTGNSTDNQTIGHGLGATPEALWMYPIQVAANNGNTQRPMWFSANSANHNFNTGLNENRTESDSTNGRISAREASSRGSSTIFTVRVGNSSYEAVNHSSQNYMCIAWRSVQGFSKIGMYHGNSSTDGTFVYTGFKPAFVLCKRVGGNNDFRCFDTKRDPVNTGGGGSVNICANYGAEWRDANSYFDFLSNGFKLRTTHVSLNGSDDYAFMAFAENPFVTSTGVPTTAR
jgi:hypothetical protein